MYCGGYVYLHSTRIGSVYVACNESHYACKIDLLYMVHPVLYMGSQSDWTAICSRDKPLDYP